MLTFQNLDNMIRCFGIKEVLNRNLIKLVKKDTEQVVTLKRTPIRVYFC